MARRVARRVLQGLLGLAVLVLALEVGLHSWQQRMDNPALYVPDAVLGWRFRSGPHRNSSGRIHTNAEGLFNAEVPRSRQDREVRVLCLGDSVTCGMTQAARTFPSFLESELAAVDPSRVYRVINGGVPAYTSLQGLLLLDRLAPLYRPDLLVVTFLNNEGFVRPYSRVPSWDFDLTARTLLYGSELYRLRLVSLMEERGVYPQAYSLVRDMDAAEAFRLNLGAFREHARELGVRILFVEEALAYPDATPGPRPSSPVTPPVSPRRLAQLQGILREETLGRGLPLVRVADEPGFGALGRGFFNPDDFVHPSTAGNELMARAVARALHAQGMPDRP